MLIGTLPSFGQCPTTEETDAAQTFCYLETVGDISTDGDAIYQTADIENDTQPIPDTEYLASGSYYVGSTTEECTTRIEVVVTVNSAPRPVNLITDTRVSGFEFTTCASETFSAGDLEDLFTNDPDYTLEVYESEFVTTAYTGTLTPGESYFVGQVYTSTTGSGCPSLRTAVRFNPSSIEGPTATSPQTFCEGATVANLEATGTYENTQAIRWYRSANGNEPLPETTELINGQTYFAGQVVNDSDSPLPPCETPSGLDSEDNPFRTPVTVTVITFDAGDDSTGNVICKADLDTRIEDPNENAQEILLSFKDDIDFTYESVSFSPMPESIYESYLLDPYQTFTTTATFVTAEGCEDDVVIEFTVLESYNAGADNELGNEVCRAEFSTPPTEQEVEDYLTSLLSEGVDPGTFSNVAQITDDINNGLEGPFNSTYTAGTGSCADTAKFAFSVLETPNLQQYALSTGVTEVTLCNADIPNIINSVPQDVIDLYMKLIPGAPTGGTFTNMTINDIVSAYNQNNFQTFETTYTVTSDNGCSDSIVLSYTIIEGETANAGDFDNIEDVCTNAEPIDLTALTNTGNNPTEGGTFTGEGVANNVFDPSTVEPGTYDITYTVDETMNCVSGDDETIFTIEVIQGPITATVNREFCITEANELITNELEAQSFINELVGEAGVDNVELTGFDSEDFTEADDLWNFLENPSTDSETFTFTYNNTSTNVCEDGLITINITINDTQDANAGSDVTYTVCEGDAMIDLTEILSSDAMTGGEFTGDGVTDNMFDPSIGIDEDGYEIIYTVDPTSDCVSTDSEPDTAIYTIIVLEGRELGDPITDDICVGNLQPNYSVPAVTNYFASLIPNYSSNGEFEPSMTVIADQYNNAVSKIGTYETTYTLGTGDCEDFVLVTVNVEGEINAEAGDDFSTTFCSNEADVNLYDFISEDANPNGTFVGFEDGNFSPSQLEPDTYTFNYEVGPSNACVEGDDFAEFVITVYEAPFAGEDFSETICITQAEEMIEDPQAAIDWFTSIVDVEGVDQDGEFDPALMSLAVDVFAYVSAPDSPSATFETTYTVTNENCEDFANISLTINNLEEAEAGDAVALTFCVSQGEFDLRDYLSDDANPNGYFEDSDDFEDFEGIINTSELGEDVYTFTYTVDETVDCVTGEESIDFTVTIIGDLDAGSDNSTSICNANIVDGMFPNSTSVRDYYLNMLDEGVSRDGTFSPSIQDLVNWYNNESEIGEFTTTYTISEGECSDSTVLSVTVYDAIPANVGDEIGPQTVCSSDEDIDLYTYLSGDANTNGTFEGYEDGMFSPSMMGAGTYDVTYTVNEETPCVEGEASITFTITVEQGANAGEDMPVTVCSNDDLQDLFSLISADADMDGEFTLDGEVIADGIMDPSTFEVGTYEVIYSVMAGDDECGEDDMATITITLNEAPDAPTTAESVAFCAIDGETAAVLEAEGTNLTWYSDADLTMMVSEEDILVDGEYYVTQSTDEGCESDAAMLMVNIEDSPAPTINSDYELCAQENPTIGDLSEEINEAGTVSWYDSADSMESLSNNAMLTDGTTYYATLITESGCESSERLAVTLTLTDCAVFFPEVITPNGDTRNDIFVIENIERDFPNYNITIFNRWGNAVYKGNASTPEWDGTSNQSGSLGDDILPVGVYFYVVDFNDGSTSPRQGKVYLNR
jgi:gliding motility-associated-like protein